ncbi:capsular biosynthesis protein [Priestia aryabhattai]|uniref:lipopolysaccharide biosynthesis protein n=1 Tax=Priestia aryabhattai TaxID=412384 RepID=UPI001C8D66A9|nr:hypothetical protein [Priestia aryabhattai]MBY0076505.1 capsular biosynthesis protein [Priestia aryabhattai]
MKLIKDIFKVFNSNMLMLISNTIITVLLPLTLSVEGYGEYRQYILYISYIGICHLGYIDGIYIKYGGKNLNENKELLRKEHSFLVKFQFVITIVLVAIAIILKDIVLFLLSISIIPVNISSFYKMLYQSTGLFSKYSRINILFTIINLLSICFLLIFGINSSYYYIGATLFAYLCLLISLEINFLKVAKGIEKQKDFKYGNYFKIGIFILLGNFSIQLINNLGLWIVNIFFEIKDFSHFSFATSMLNMVLIAVSAVGLTFYNYLAKKEDPKIVILAKKLLIILGVSGGAIYFVLELFINKFIPTYSLSLKIISIAFLNLPYLMIINVIIINLYKARKQEKKFFRVILFIFLISLIIHLASYLIFKSLVPIAMATTLTYIIWYTFSVNKDFKYLKSSGGEIILLTIYLLSFYLCANYLNWLYGGLIYLAINSITIFVCYRADLRVLFDKVSNKSAA